MSEPSRWDHRLETLRQAADVRKFEISLFWQRSLFFWGLIAAAFIAYASLAKEADKNLRLYVACFGFVASVAWTLANRGSKYWQTAWEKKTESAERDVLEKKLFSDYVTIKSEGFWGPTSHSVSKLSTALSDFTIIIWALLAVKALPISWPHFMKAIAPFIAVVGSIAYAILMALCCRSHANEKFNKRS